jgi:hypothetical protein
MQIWRNAIWLLRRSEAEINTSRFLLELHASPRSTPCALAHCHHGVYAYHDVEDRQEDLKKWIYYNACTPLL